MTKPLKSPPVTTLHVSPRVAALLDQFDRSATERWLSVIDAASRLGVHPNTVRRAIARGGLHHCRVGRRVLVRLPKATR